MIIIKQIIKYNLRYSKESPLVVVPSTVCLSPAGSLKTEELWRALPHCIHQANLPVHTHTLLMNWWAMFMRNHLPARQISNRCLLAYEPVVEPLLWFPSMKDWNVKVFPDLLARQSLRYTLQMYLKGTVPLK